jgi:hypothetical protein
MLLLRGRSDSHDLDDRDELDGGLHRPDRDLGPQVSRER